MDIAIKLLIVAGGGALGFLYYKFIGCKSGACPLTSTPTGSIIMGVFIAATFVLDR